VKEVKGLRGSLAFQLLQQSAQLGWSCTALVQPGRCSETTSSVLSQTQGQVLPLWRYTQYHLYGPSLGATFSISLALCGSGWPASTGDLQWC
jgi:hypothetical protein